MGGNLALLLLVGARQLDTQVRARNADLLLELWQGRERSEPESPAPRVESVTAGELRVNKASPSTCRSLAEQLRPLGLDPDTMREILLENGCRDKER
jgi:hypothetical protein